MNTPMLDQAREMSTNDLETLIADLAEIRAGKQPGVPMSRPKPGTSPETNISMQDEPSIEARLLKDGRIRLWIRNAGIGWLAFNLSHEQSLTLRDFMIANTDQEAVSALLRTSDGQGNAH